MAIYLVVFAISIFLISLSEFIKKKIVNKKVEKLIYIFTVGVALCIPSVLAGMRDYSIGTDVLTYGNIWFYNAVGSDFKVYTNWATSSSIGYLYAVINYIVAHFTINPHYFYFIYNFIENIIIFIAIYKNRDVVNVPLAMMAYYLLFYNLFLNILRQGMALSLILLGFSLLREKRYVSFLIIVYIAILFHNTAGIAVIFLLLYIFLKKNITLQSNLIIIIVILFEDIIRYLGSLGLVGDRYLMYINTEGVSGGFYQHLLGFCMPTLILFCINRSNLKSNIDYNFLLFVIITSTCFSFLMNKYTFLSRITLYFDIFFIISLPYILKNGNVRFSYKGINLNKYLAAIYLLIYWVIIYGYFNSGNTVPYIFMRS
ncbi:hypothetical protein A8C40_06465 [Ligilactobacillus salivarius]|nr:hypothetical protein A8C40_06465 [Ligilactobacillus salivarius]